MENFAIFNKSCLFSSTSILISSVCPEKILELYSYMFLSPIQPIILLMNPNYCRRSNMFFWEYWHWIYGNSSQIKKIIRLFLTKCCWTCCEIFTHLRWVKNTICIVYCDLWKYESEIFQCSYFSIKTNCYYCQLETWKRQLRVSVHNLSI